MAKMSQIIAKNGNIWTSCTLYRKRIKLLPKMAIFGQAVEVNQIIAKNGKNLSQIIAKNGNIWTRVVLIWMIKVAKNGKKR